MASGRRPSNPQVWALGRIHLVVPLWSLRPTSQQSSSNWPIDSSTLCCNALYTCHCDSNDHVRNTVVDQPTALAELLEDNLNSQHGQGALDFEGHLCHVRAESRPGCACLIFGQICDCQIAPHSEGQGVIATGILALKQSP